MKSLFESASSGYSPSHIERRSGLIDAHSAPTNHSLYFSTFLIGEQSEARLRFWISPGLPIEVGGVELDEVVCSLACIEQPTNLDLFFAIDNRPLIIEIAPRMEFDNIR